MKGPKKTAIGLAMAAAAGIVIAQPALAQQVEAGDETLFAQTLSQGESVRAIAELKTALEQYPGDPAILINLGIAYAQAGASAEARESFEAALSNRDVVELETAEGDMTDSRRLARRALAMLERGKFRSQAASSTQFTLRD